MNLVFIWTDGSLTHFHDESLVYVYDFYLGYQDRPKVYLVKDNTLFDQMWENGDVIKEMEE